MRIFIDSVAEARYTCTVISDTAPPSLQPGERGLIDSYFAAVMHERLWPAERSLRRYVHWLFRGVPLAGSRVLSIGRGGAGVFSIYAAVNGAASVNWLKSDSDGSFEGMSGQFRRLAYAVGVQDRVRPCRQTFQEFEPAPGEQFDVVLIHNAINHLRESDAAHLHETNARGERARDVYHALFQKLTCLSNPNGHLLITDYARTKCFSLLGRRHPFEPDTQCEIHQDPGIWRSMLADTGFTAPRVAWGSFNRMGALGRALLATGVGAFFCAGDFRLHMRRASAPGRSVVGFEHVANDQRNSADNE